MSKTLVFEIGTEEMPAAAAAAGVEQMKNGAAELLAAYRLNNHDHPAIISSYGTPRRLVLIVEKLIEAQSPATEETKGPPKQAAFDDAGRPTPAAAGFAKTQGVKVENLEIREVQGREYVFAIKEHPGLPAQEILPEMLKKLAGSLEFAKTMRWGDGRLRFIRPIRWLLALYGSDVIPVELDSLKSGRRTWGHRFLAEGPFEVPAADQYLKIMKKAKVVFSNTASEEAAVKGMIEAAAEAAGGRAAVNLRVLREVVYLVEDPHAVVGIFDKEFLEIPRTVAVTAMESHQRYFPIEDKKGRLMPLFAVVHNGDPKYNEQIARGHERVLRARLADAAFFFHEDSRTTLESKIDRLKGVVWQAKLGTVFAKVERIRKIGAALAGRLGLDDRQKAMVERAARLAKADLTTAMVIEFTDLQGEVGREYAIVDGEEPEVAQAVGEHWRPRFAGDELPATTTGRIVALADKIDTIVGCFLVGLIPTGSADPYSLRRQAAGIIGILGATRWQIAILDLIQLAIGNYAAEGVSSADPQAVAAQVQEFIFARLKRALVDGGIEPETIEAVTAVGFDVVADIEDRARIIDGLRGKNELEDVKLAFTRCQNLAAGEVGEDVAPDLFEHEEEERLFARARAAKSDMAKIVDEGRLEVSIELLASLKGPIDDFFDTVLVMAPDEKIRNNRLRLLNLCLSVSRRIADFSKLP